MELWYEPTEIIRRFKELNPDIRAYATAWYGRNKEKQVKRAAEWHNSHLQARKLHRARWSKSPNGRASKHARRVRRNYRLNGAHFTGAEWQEKLELFQYRCAYCKRKVKKLTVDHIIPLALNGSNTIDNVVPACLRCNTHKSIAYWPVQSTLPLS